LRNSRRRFCFAQEKRSEEKRRGEEKRREERFALGFALLVSSNWSALILRFENQHSAFLLLLAAKRKGKQRELTLSLSLFLSGNSQGLGLTRRSSVLFCFVLVWFGLVFVFVNVWEEGEGTTLQRTWVSLFLQVLRTFHVLSAFLLHFQKRPKHTRTQKWCFVSVFHIFSRDVYEQACRPRNVGIPVQQQQQEQQEAVHHKRKVRSKARAAQRERERGVCGFCGRVGGARSSSRSGCFVLLEEFRR